MTGQLPRSDPRVAQFATLLRYKAWAMRITLGAVTALPEEEALRPRATNFGNMVHTLNHVWVVEDIFRHHLEGRAHGYTARNTAEAPSLPTLIDRVRAMDDWWIALVDSLDGPSLDELVEFEFVGGGASAMTRAEILHHVVNHSTYHRGFVGDMLNQVGVVPPASDFTVYLRDVMRGSAGGR